MDNTAKEKELLMLIRCLRSATESLKESGMWARGLGNSDKNEQRDKIGELTLRATANAETALVEAYKLMTMITSDEAGEMWIKAYGEGRKRKCHT